MGRLYIKQLWTEQRGNEDTVEMDEGGSDEVIQ
jgi:hypothetical protein